MTLIITLLSIAYWIYLAMTTQMVIAQDAIGYEQLGKLLSHNGFIDYFTTGPNREPIYPLLVAFSMKLSTITHWHYTKIMAFVGVIILTVTQLQLRFILQQLRINQRIINVAICLLALSPAINNSAFSLYSEIITYPLILNIVLCCFWLSTSLNQQKLSNLIAPSLALGISLSLITLSKAVFELISPLLLITLSLWLCYHSRNRLIVFSAMLICTCMYYIPIHAYKTLNNTYNNHFAITNRGSWALYGNTARRSEPLNLNDLSCALAYVPGEGVCSMFCSPQQCDFWSYRQSDALGLTKLALLNKKNISEKEQERILINDSKELLFKKPLQNSILMGLEGLKMFFWESTQIGFVQYPLWLQHIYDQKLFNNALRLIMALLSAYSFWHILINFSLNKNNGVVFATTLLITFFIILHSFFFILTRYAFPIVPLYFICISVLLQKIWYKSD